MEIIEAKYRLHSCQAFLGVSSRQEQKFASSNTILSWHLLERATAKLTTHPTSMHKYLILIERISEVTSYTKNTPCHVFRNRIILHLHKDYRIWRHCCFSFNAIQLPAPKILAPAAGTIELDNGRHIFHIQYCPRQCFRSTRTIPLM